MLLLAGPFLLGARVLKDGALHIGYYQIRATSTPSLLAQRSAETVDTDAVAVKCIHYVHTALRPDLDLYSPISKLHI